VPDRLAERRKRRRFPTLMDGPALAAFVNTGGTPATAEETCPK